ncbi:MAG: preprotein translocase subunit YajC [Actinobacteria bacterium]|nr:preprotein translocase subunit YajC [Actinomycetota bacterium]
MEQLLPLAFLLVVMYFLLIRPQQQRVKAQRSLVSSLAVGDEIVTVGGLVGRIVALDDDTATVETTPGTVLRFRRAAISGRITPQHSAEPDTSPISED